mgnify:CR=1 FL=1
MRKDNNSLSYTNMKGYYRLRRIRAVKPRFFIRCLKVRQKVRFITLDMSGANMPLARRLIPNAKIIIDRFHIIQSLGRALFKPRIDTMNPFNKKSLPYRDLKNH